MNASNIFVFHAIFAEKLKAQTIFILLLILIGYKETEIQNAWPSTDPLSLRLIKWCEPGYASYLHHTHFRRLRVIFLPKYKILYFLDHPGVPVSILTTNFEATYRHSRNFLRNLAFGELQKFRNLFFLRSVKTTWRTQISYAKATVPPVFRFLK